MHPANCCLLLLLAASCVCTIKAQACTEFDLRLVGGLNEREGRVEICFNGDWGTVCDDFWSDDDATVVCRQLGISTPGAFAVGNAYFGSGEGDIVLDDVGCAGTEERLIDCDYNDNHNCFHSEDAGVICPSPDFTCTDGEIRLSGGETENEGRVEICFDNVFGTVCDDQWDQEAATVVCRQLDFQTDDAIQLSRAAYGPGVGPIWIDDIDCIGNETALSNCSHRGQGIHNCGHSEDAGVLCQPTNNTCEGGASPGDLRLVEGRTAAEGRVEVCFHGKWGTVCDDLWGEEEAQVVCRQLGFTDEDGVAIGSAGFGQGEGPILFDNLECIGNETDLLSCPNDGIAVHNCFHSEDASVSCRDEASCMDGTVVLADGSVSSEGRVEVCVNGHWGTICDDDWDNLDAAVVCNSLGYPGLAISVQLAFFGEGKGIIWFDDVDCAGDEETVFNCSHRGAGVENCHHREDAGVICQSTQPDCACQNGDILLLDGNVENEGRVEICFNCQWGTICDDNWDNSDATAVCNQLGLLDGTPLAVQASLFAVGDGIIFLDEVGCVGNESRLVDCVSVNEVGQHNCFHSEDAGVICPAKNPTCKDGDLRLRGSASPNYGRVEICINSQWGTICDDFWGNQEALIVCRQLGLDTSGPIAIAGGGFGAGDGPIYLDNLLCVGSEVNLLECTGNAIGDNNCGHSQDAAVLCGEPPCTEGRIRLADGFGDYSGRVEVCLNGLWSSVCASSVNQNVAGQFCEKLGLKSEGVITLGGVHFREGSGIVHEYFQCADTTQQECFIASSDCDELSIICQANDSATCRDGEARLTGGERVDEGRVDICFNGTWGTICDDSWDDRGASVLCRQLGFSDTDVEAFRGMFLEGTAGEPIWIDDMKCSGTESNILYCNYGTIGLHNCDHSEDAGLRCSKPTEGTPVSSPSPSPTSPSVETGSQSQSQLAAAVVPLVLVILFLLVVMAVVGGIMLYRWRQPVADYTKREGTREDMKYIVKDDQLSRKDDEDESSPV